jgi:hypothetical protein
MATNVTVYDLENYPDNNKTVVVDHKQVVTTQGAGDETWVLSASTTATASGSASIQDVFINKFVVGWSKSTGFSQGPYTINSGQKNLKVSINGSTAREISLTESVVPVSGDDVAADMQTQINALAATGGAEAGNLAFKNAWVTFDDGRFIIQSGSPATYYIGSNRSSVVVSAGASNDVSSHLGFFAQVYSQAIASRTINETYLSWPVVSASGWTYVEVNDETIASAGDCIVVTDGTNSEYRYVSSVATGKININAALSNSYAANSRVQTLREQDPESNPVSVFESIDDASRFAVSSLVNQIDFS